jgi:cellulose synthase/poly-beta-1,6-N-acetylglucosamine synthase-like glycosyltransferase
VLVTCICLAVTVVASSIVGAEMLDTLLARVARGAWLSGAAQLLFMLLVAVLIYGGLVYQLTRLVHLRRCIAHCPVPRVALDETWRGEAPTLAILVPSYKEEPRVVLQTVLSAALQDYPWRRVVLLIDDPPDPGTDADAVQLRAIRALPGEIEALLAPQASIYAAAHDEFRARQARGSIDVHSELDELQSLYQQATTWFQAQADRFDANDHAERAFIEKVLLPNRDRMRERARACRDPRPTITVEQIAHEYEMLATLFSVEISGFERRRYVNLSHEANKAMNLNSYIGLLGKRFTERQECDGLHLEVAGSGPADIEVADADYVITLDADSLLTPDYALRLVNIAERSGNERVAVIQTPYSAFTGARGILERIAGATTDIQYNIHQGFSGCDATYWVGANALLRKSALMDIAVRTRERDFPITIFIQDRTVIEDTESTVDLIARGWSLFNYPERLAYSATPPDFGSLIIQRRRWANGGLIILPKLLCYLARGPMSMRKLAEAFMRVHYLVSIAAVNLALVILLAVPFTESIESWWLPMTALPYFFLYGRDLCRAGYRASDLIRVYALNLLLIPVNLGGVFKSLQQGWTREKIPFGRTPKVKGRTAAAPLYVLAAYALMLHWFTGAGFDAVEGLWAHAIFAAANAGLMLYAIAVFVGFRESLEDLRASSPWRRRSAAVPRSRTSGVLPFPDRRRLALAFSGPDRRRRALLPQPLHAGPIEREERKAG